MRKKILVMGASGMLGNAVYRHFSANGSFQVFGSIRSTSLLKYFDSSIRDGLISGVDVENSDDLIRVLARVKPDVIINCIGLVKQLSASNDVLGSLPINSMFPHRLSKMADLCGARLIHISTDCVFSGSKGGYIETDFPDANDLYGRSKYIGEVGGNAITLRTSIIGHELSGNRSLINWFLSANGRVPGYRQAIFSGLPTNELASVIERYVIPNSDLTGLYHLSADAISKYELLNIVSTVYGKDVEIYEDDSLAIDRSLDSTKFKNATGYAPAAWPQLISEMFDFNGR